MTNQFTVAAMQLCSGVEPDANIADIARWTAEAVAQGATYIVTPEVSVAFAANRLALTQVALPFDDNPHVNALAEIARRHRVQLHIGSMAIALDNGKFANRSILFGPDGEISAQYDKIHLFDADPPDDRPYRESDTYQGGDLSIVSDAPGFGLGFSICYDVRFPSLYAELASNGAEVLAVPAAFTVPTGRAHWEILLRSRAIETGSYVVAAAQGGTHENGRKTWGHSMIVDPWGAIMGHKNDDIPGLVLAKIDLKEVADARARLPVLANRRPFSLSVNHDVS